MHRRHTPHYINITVVVCSSTTVAENIIACYDCELTRTRYPGTCLGIALIYAINSALRQTVLISPQGKSYSL